LKKENIETLLEIQRSRRPPIGEILVEMNEISKEQLDKELKNYHEYLNKIQTEHDKTHGR
jgi:hypothetical protein